jgi:hypothetical protein
MNGVFGSREGSLWSRGRRGIALVVLAAMLRVTVATPAVAGTCPTPAERNALDVRALQSRLMVTALACGTRDDYNRFAVKYRKTLVRNGEIMVGYFRRNFGAKSQKHLDRYVTALANDASRTSNLNRRKFCRDSKEILAAIDGDRARNLDLSRHRETFELPTANGVPSCVAAER